ncbi:MAG: DUF3109 family protein [Muribaculaceae bacterium]|nr:DUF3109 family protein [Muribaculaceae bacterium]MDE6331217.1 DUF3109 family protein [Muribaculaceae bacterium]
MLEIGKALVSLDLAEQYFCCDLDSCLGECCIEGDAGAPITEEERKKIEEILPAIYDELLPAAQREIDENGVAYVDEEGDLVTSIIDGRNCVFTCYEAGGMCHCAIERAYRQGRIDFCKPMSCHLYPLRLTEYPDFTAVNYHKWKICRCAELLGRREGIRLYQFLKGPLERRFGAEWYAELCEACEAYLEEYGK